MPMPAIDAHADGIKNSLRSGARSDLRGPVVGRIGQPETRNWAGTTVPGSKVRVLPSQEDEQIARHTWSL